MYIYIYVCVYIYIYIYIYIWHSSLRVKCINQAFPFGATRPSSIAWCKEMLHTYWISELSEMWFSILCSVRISKFSEPCSPRFHYAGFWHCIMEPSHADVSNERTIFIFKAVCVRNVWILLPRNVTSSLWTIWSSKPTHTWYFSPNFPRIVKEWNKTQIATLRGQNPE